MAKKRKHALLSASSAARWLYCNPSARLEEQIEEDESVYAKEGTLTHELCELKLCREGMKAATYTRKMNKIKKDELYQEEMQGYTDTYVGYIETLCNSLPEKPYMAVEKRVDYSKYATEGFGTADCIVIGGKTMHVVDFKYGKGVPVSPEGNPQLALYALGALQAYSFLFPIEAVTLHVVQPRLQNSSSWTVTAEELESWGENFVKPRAELAWKGEGKFQSGAYCKFCRVANCRKRAHENLKLAEEFSMELPPVLTDEEVGEALRKAEDLLSWHKKLKKYAMDALMSGNKISQWKLVEGRSNRVIKDYAGAVEALKKKGYPRELFYYTAPLTLTEMEKAVGKKEFAEICGDFIQKPPGAPTLAKSEDKRAEYSPRASAAEDFAQ